METLQLLGLIEKNARASSTDLAKILNESEENISEALSDLEKKRVICGYHTVINWDKSNCEKVMAVIEVKAMPEREHGYDAVAEHIYKYPEVEACYLMSGNSEFLVIINGRTMQEVANFVGRKLAPIHGVTGTTTHFVLKRYKVEGIVLESEQEVNEKDVNYTMIKMEELNPIVVNCPPSGIRKFFDLARTVEGVISLGVGEPDFATPWDIREEAIYTIEKARTFYTPNQGLPELRSEICNYVKRRFDLHYKMENVLVTVGGSEAIDIIFRTILQEGDEVIVLTPGYVAYEPCICLAHGVPVCVELKEENEFRLMKEDLEKAITPKTKAILMNFPSNPTGGIMRESDYAEIVPLIKEHGLYVVSDEIYAELTYEGTHTSIASFEEIKDHVLVINGFSKAYSMTGWRLGYILADEMLIPLLNKVHQYAIMCAPTISQYAGLAALRRCDEEVVRMKQSFEQRRNYLVNSLNEIGLKTVFPKGAFYVFPCIAHTGLTSEEFCERLLNEQKVACVPGTAFGKEGEGFIRISYAYSIEQIRAALERIAVFLRNLDNEKVKN